MSTKQCKSCRGTGHDKHSRPIIKRNEPVLVGGIKQVKPHHTVKLGSGCMTCLGTGRV